MLFFVYNTFLIVWLNVMVGVKLYGISISSRKGWWSYFFHLCSSPHIIPSTPQFSCLCFFWNTEEAILWSSLYPFVRPPQSVRYLPSNHSVVSHRLSFDPLLSAGWTCVCFFSYYFWNCCELSVLSISIQSFSEEWVFGMNNCMRKKKFVLTLGWEIPLLWRFWMCFIWDRKEGSDIFKMKVFLVYEGFASRAQTSEALGKKEKRALLVWKHTVWTNKESSFS